MRCCKCSCDLPPGEEHWIHFYCGNGYGSQSYTCCECLNYYCNYCDDDENLLLYCGSCERRLCVDCQSMKFCNGCELHYCVNCKDFTECSNLNCNNTYCEECVGRYYSEKCCKCGRIYCYNNETGCDGRISSCRSCNESWCDDCDQIRDWPHCEDCSNTYCEDCKVKEGLDVVQNCESCKKDYCGKCLVSRCQGDFWRSPTDCPGCIKIAGPFLLKEKARKGNAHVSS